MIIQKYERRERCMALRVNPMEEYEKDKIRIIGRNVQLSAPIREHIHTKIQRIEGLTPPVIHVTVYLEKIREQFRVEIMYKFSHFDVFATGIQDDMYMSIDQACAILRNKLRKWKKEIKMHHHKKPSDIEMDLQIVDFKKEDVAEINDLIEEENIHEVESALTPPKIVKHEKKSVPLLTLEEAAMRMDLSLDKFLVYRSEEDLNIKVMYYRGDNTLGILDLECS